MAQGAQGPQGPPGQALLPANPPWTTRVHEAAKARNWIDLETFLAQGDNPNEIDPSGNTALEYLLLLQPPNDENLPQQGDELNSERFARFACMNVLLKRGVNPNRADKGGWTVAHRAAWHGDVNAIKFLARYGVRLASKNARGQMPSDLAAIKSRWDIVAYLDGATTNLQILCRNVIRESLGRKVDDFVDRLPLPKRLKLIVNFGLPYRGWSGRVIPASPWDMGRLGSAPKGEMHAFLCENASTSLLSKYNVERDAISRDETLVAAFREMYLKNEFAEIAYEEPVWKFRDYSAGKPKVLLYEEGLLY